MIASNFNADEKTAIVSIINRLGHKNAHPIATKDNLGYFKSEYVKKLIDKNFMKFSDKGKKVCGRILFKIDHPVTLPESYFYDLGKIQNNPCFSNVDIMTICNFMGDHGKINHIILNARIANENKILKKYERIEKNA